MRVTSKQKTALIIAFIQGAQWWEWTIHNATMWPSDRDRAAAEAEDRLKKGVLGKLKGDEP